jgi:hypothetical protein
MTRAVMTTTSTEAYTAPIALVAEAAATTTTTMT